MNEENKCNAIAPDYMLPECFHGGGIKCCRDTGHEDPRHRSLWLPCLRFDPNAPDSPTQRQLRAMLEEKMSPEVVDTMVFVEDTPRFIGYEWVAREPK